MCLVSNTINRSKIVKGTVKIQVTTIKGVRCQNFVNSNILDYFSVKNWPNLSIVIFVPEFQIRSTKLFHDIIWPFWFDSLKNVPIFWTAQLRIWIRDRNRFKICSFLIRGRRHSMFLEWWNTTKCLSNIWQHFSCLLNKGTTKTFNPAITFWGQTMAGS